MTIRGEHFNENIFFLIAGYYLIIVSLFSMYAQISINILRGRHVQSL